MLNNTPLIQVLVAVAAVVIAMIAVGILLRSNKKSHDYSDMMREGTSVSLGIIMLAVAIGLGALIPVMDRIVDFLASLVQSST